MIHREWSDGFAPWIRIVAVLVLLWPATLRAGSFGDYKEEKHDSGGSTVSGRTDDDTSESSSEDDGPDVVGSVLSAIFSDDGDSTSEASADVDEGVEANEATRYATRSCHYRTFNKCLSRCAVSKGACREQCRGKARQSCGVSMYAAGASGYGVADRGPVADGTFAGGFGLVEGGRQGMARGVLHWNHFGFGAQSSLVWDSGAYLLETDVGPMVYFPESQFQYGFQPSLMMSAGDRVETLYGVGLRTHLRYERPEWFMTTRPLFGFIGGDFNLQMRTGIGYRFTDHVHVEAGHDFRFVSDLRDRGRSLLHGGYLSVGYDF